ncbi:hypothetical protein Pcinc_021918 [Petrolisthes cinctipes]|uniref:Uncharacterized protein n=1 Tax=Petrolisthes cinctipes TaxID=88211 RepID=A0AAE1FIX8_PETCI|nr:hypothetical protein Pcinc_021918 [Petrolisthes cinctipes]
MDGLKVRQVHLIHKHRSLKREGDLMEGKVRGRRFERKEERKEGHIPEEEVGFGGRKREGEPEKRGRKSKYTSEASPSHLFNSTTTTLLKQLITTTTTTADTTPYINNQQKP